MKRFGAGVLFLGLALVCADSRAAQPLLTGTPEIRYSLEKLNTLGSLLMIGAHPDDENSAVIAYYSRGRKIRTGYLSMTRGEGGQNLLGPEQGDLLGVIRTQELLAARSMDGASQYFTRAVDFGFTKTPQEAIEKWGHDRMLADIVWVIRQQQPDAIVLCFSGTPADGHGQHQASAILGKEAYEAAADPTKFPEQLKWVKPWRAKRIVQSRFAGPPGGGRGGPGGPGGPPAGAPPAQQGGRGGRGTPDPNVPTITIDSGEFNPVYGRAYREIATLSRDQHKSQAMVSPMGYGASPSILALVSGDAPKQDLFDGVDTSWNRVPGGARVGELVGRALKEFDDMHPENAVPALLEARPLVADLAASGNVWAGWKLEELDRTIALCAALHTEAEADAPAYVPGATAKLKFTAINRTKLPIQLTGVSISAWGNPSAPAPKPLEYNKAEVVNAEAKVPANEPYSTPFWLAKPRTGDWYDIADQTLIGRADIVPQVIARFDFTLNAQKFSISEPLHYRYADPARDEFVRPVAIEPPVAISAPASGIVVPIGASQDVSAQVRALAANQSGEVRLIAPNGWKVEPASVAFDLTAQGATKETRFRLTPPATAQTGSYRLVAKLKSGIEVATDVDVIDYAHIPAQTVLEPSAGKLSAVSVKSLAKRVGYVMGSSDSVPEALRQMGIKVDLLGDKELASADLAVYDAIVTGVRAYAVRADLRAAQQRLMDYARNGGTLLVQYNNPQDRRISPSVTEAYDHMGPYPFTLSQGNSMRVTEEDAPVTILDAKSALLHAPNEITNADFDGWVQERGIYFVEKWDSQYKTLWASHDKGEKDMEGSLLYTKLGKGAYIYTTVSFFRQLPAGVPGAYRIFANLLSAGKTLK